MKSSSGRTRIDLLLFEKGLAKSRNEAQALIMSGRVQAAGVRIDKPGVLVNADAALVIERPPRYVSRGGDKLEGALEAFGPQGLRVLDAVCVDVGASTGGFTDCLLQHGASKVYAVDVGYGQLADRLRRDERVVVRERMNARTLTGNSFPEVIDLVVVDASFIGIGKLIGPIAAFLGKDGALVALIKPQFEAGREAVNRGKGVIRDEQARSVAIATGRGEIIDAGFAVVAEVDSPIRGPKGNLERFLFARKA